MWQQKHLLQHPLIRYLPHINDSLLFSAGLTLLILEFPSLNLVPPWLWLKLSLLLLYIFLGYIAFKHHPSLWRQKIAFIMAIIVFICMVTLAIQKYHF